MKIQSTYSPCCKMHHEGIANPGIVHTGACRGEHGGELGPTLFLVDLNEVCRTLLSNSDKFKSKEDCYQLIETFRAIT